jgi:hypothetical protein
MMVGTLATPGATGNTWSPFDRLNPPSGCCKRLLGEYWMEIGCPLALRA